MVGTTVGDYTIASRLPVGSRGETWLAHDTTLNRTVALTILTSSLTLDQSTRVAFLQRARAAAAVDHPNIASIHGAGELPDGGLWVARGWSGGRSLREREKTGPLPLDEAVDIAVQAGRGLQRASQAGLVYGNLGPDDLVITDGGQTLIYGEFRKGMEEATSDIEGLGSMLREMISVE